MVKYEAGDFGYSPVINDVTTDDLFHDVSYVDNKDKVDAKMAGGALIGLSGCCCCLSISLIIAGAFLLAYHPDNQAQHGTGAVLLAVGVFTFCMAFLFCCVTMCVSCVLGLKGDRNGKDWDIERLNDRFKGEVELFNEVRFSVGGSSCDNKSLLKLKATMTRKKEEEEKKQRKHWEQSVKSDLERGVEYEDSINQRRPVVFKIDFDGDISVSSIDTLRDQISLCLKLGSKLDQVCVVITSPGGSVTMYGLAGSQLVRVKKAGMKLVVCVDSIAASGGYLMASVADVIYAAPFSLVGSIGVISIVPNVHKLLQKHDVETYVMTAGEYKSTVNVIGEVTESGKEKYMEELEKIHQVFKDHICANRPALAANISNIATGEAWLAIEGKQLGLVDELLTSDEFIASSAATHDIISIEPKSTSNWYNFPAGKMGYLLRSVSSIFSPNSTLQPMLLK